MDDDVFHRLRTFVYRRSGIHFPRAKKHLFQSQVLRRMRSVGIQDFRRYCAGLQDGEIGSEPAKLLNALTINETFFFRNPAQLEILTHEILPEIAWRRRALGKKSIHIWSAGCSTGDEPYSIAMLVREHLVHAQPELQFSITGTDINTEVLKTARRATYGSPALRNVPQHILDRYFVTANTEFVLVPEIRRMVRFRRHNLAETSAGTLPEKYDLIVCANVLIYFDLPARRRVVDLLCRRLRRGGSLLVGPSETLQDVTDALTPVRFSRMVAYRKDER